MYQQHGTCVGEGFPEEVTFEIFQFCLELLLSGSLINFNVWDQMLLHCTLCFTCPCFLLSRNSLLTC